MGLLTSLVTLPLAPVRGVAWLAEQLEAEAYRQMYGVEGVRAQLEQLGRALDAGEISEEQYEAEEEALLDRLDEALAAEQEGAAGE
jgi:hypothetical protein